MRATGTTIITATILLLGIATPGAGQEASRALRELSRARASVAARIDVAAAGIDAAAAALSDPVVQNAIDVAAHAAIPPEPWDDQDPADSAYRAGRRFLSRGNYTQAAYWFSRVRNEHPKSTYVADAYYWEAWARYRQGSTEGLKTARDLLRQQGEKFPSASTRNDAKDLEMRVCGVLARRGDEDCAEKINRDASRLDTPRAPAAPAAPSAPSAASAPSAPKVRSVRSRCRDDDDDDRMAALNALLQMDEDRALPILKKVMARRDEGATCLRRKAVFMISQHHGLEAESMLLDAVRNDPDPEVRENAVFWLGQAGGEHAVAALDSILRTADDRAVQEKAIFAISQTGSSRGMQILRDFAMKQGAPLDLRENAIFWIGQSGRDAVPFLKTLYKSVREESLKDKIIFSISQTGGTEATRWLADVAGDTSEEIEIRKKAIFWLGQTHTSIAELFAIYDKSPEREIKESLIFAYSQRHEKAAVDKLIEIAKTEKDRELRKKALFWLSQTRDPRVAEILEQMLEKP